MADLENSSQLSSKIRIKLGEIELEFEGTEQYIRSDLPNLLEQICTYSVLEANQPKLEVDIEESEELPANPDPTKQKVQMTTNSIAAKMEVKTGTDLLLAACAHLCLVKGIELFERKNILAEMQTASNYYKESYGGNLSKSLSTLVKTNKLIERSKDKYALTAKTKQEMEANLV
ncbi:hypothetical protein VB774_10185 [Pseudanabaena galeata UHCC 0370]|uniref:Uncharacterized protein n=1 Tax=Pseudanabaena galeata UHCC 0370 TaxID=3110310 RepID=A0ABU5TI80_9CYAN|nr:hypothetical protein [Pseudanabaena galeata]MEA5477986.1 hypothetical protein [Pseudanabaena galeata UHCC 0370]